MLPLLNNVVDRGVDDTVGTTRLTGHSMLLNDVPELLVVTDNITIVGFSIGHANGRYSIITTVHIT